MKQVRFARVKAAWSRDQFTSLPVAVCVSGRGCQVAPGGPASQGEGSSVSMVWAGWRASRPLADVLRRRPQVGGRYDFFGRTPFSLSQHKRNAFCWQKQGDRFPVQRFAGSFLNQECPLLHRDLRGWYQPFESKSRRAQLTGVWSLLGATFLLLLL